MNIEPEGHQVPNTLRIVIYLRQSDKEQRLSISQQRQECMAYAQSRGWKIVRIYVDNGRSGSKDIRKRVEFHRMIAEAESLRDVDAVLTWDTARFGRLDSITGAPFKDRLRKAGVHLETTRGDSIDWSTSMGRIQDVVKSEADHDYSLSRSSDGLRGRKALIDMGYWVGPVPFGYDRQYFEGGEVQTVVPRSKVFSKPRNWHVKPVPNDQDAAIVRWLFHEWETKDMSFNGTVKALLKKGVLSPAGKGSWTMAQIKQVLKQQAYCGDIVCGHRATAKEVHNRMGVHERKDKIPPLIGRKTFEIVLKKVMAREGATWLSKSDSGPLSGILYCGHCGYRMARRTLDNRIKYVCESDRHRAHLGCHQWRVDEQVVLPHVCKALAEAVDLKVIEEMAARPNPEEKATEIVQMKKSVDRLRAQVGKASRNILLVDEENMASAKASLTSLRRDYEREVLALESAEGDFEASQRRDWYDWWQKARQRLVEVIPVKFVPTGEIVRDEIALDENYNPCDFSGICARVVQPVHMEAAVLRDLLLKLNVEVHFKWMRKGRRNWKITESILKAMFSPVNSVTRDLEVSSVRRAMRVRRARRAGWRPGRSR